MANRYYCPAGRILAHSGTHYSQLLNCFVLPFEDDSLEEIMNTAKNMAIIQKHGGGVGFNYSTLRPSGSYIKGVNGRSCGVLGFIHMMSTVSEVIEQGGCLTKDTLINSSEGLLYFDEIIKNINKGWHSHNFRVKTKDGDNCSRRYYVKGHSDIISLKTDVGTELKGTPNHKVYVFNEKGFNWVEFKDICKGDYLVYKMNQHEGVTQILNNNLPDNIHFNCIVPEKLPKYIDEKFAFFLGYFLGNGFSTSKENDYRVGVSIPTKSYLNKEIETLIKDLFGNNISVLSMKKEDDDSTTYYVSNKIIKEYLSINGFLKDKSLNASIPKKIRCCDRSIIGSYILGLFEADGGLDYGYPKLTSSSYQMIKEVQNILFGLGIPSKIFSPKRTSGFSDNIIHGVKIMSFIGLERWNNNIGSDIRSRFNITTKFRPDLSREKNYLLPFSKYWLKDVLNNIPKNKTDKDKYLVKHIRRYLRGDRNFTFSSYVSLIKKYPGIERYLPPINDMFFSQVVSIENGKENTFDLEVNNTHSYIANSLICHNSRRGASLGLLEVSHPDIWEFIGFKNDHNWDRLKDFVTINDEDKWSCFKFENLYKLQMYNISVGINDEFLKALKEDQNWPLYWKDKEWELFTVVYKKDKVKYPEGENQYIEKRFEVTADCDKTALWKVRKKVPFPKGSDIFEIADKRKIKAKEIWDRICYNAWADGCPGILNISTIRRMHNIEYVRPFSSVNPCGEQILSVNNVCNLSSIVLPSFVNNGVFDFDKFKNIIRVAVRFADDVIDNCTFPSPQIKERAEGLSKNCRNRKEPEIFV
jgi:intein/homing endonuclease